MFTERTSFCFSTLLLLQISVSLLPLFLLLISGAQLQWFSTKEVEIIKILTGQDFFRLTPFSL